MKTSMSKDLACRNEYPSSLVRIQTTVRSKCARGNSNKIRLSILSGAGCRSAKCCWPDAIARDNGARPQHWVQGSALPRAKKEAAGHRPAAFHLTIDG